MPTLWYPQAWLNYWALYLSAVDNTVALAELMTLAESRSRT